MPIDHHARAREAWEHLVELARAKDINNTISYGELADKQELHHRSARWFLGVIQEYCAEHKLPPLQALAVNAKTRLPGTGYRGSAITARSHRLAVVKVLSYEWPDTAPF